MVIAHFKSGRFIEYTEALTAALLSDPEILTVADAETGEIITAAAPAPTPTAEDIKNSFIQSINY